MRWWEEGGKSTKEVLSLPPPTKTTSDGPALTDTKRKLRYCKEFSFKTAVKNFGVHIFNMNDLNLKVTE